MRIPGNVEGQPRPRSRVFYGWYIVAAAVAMNFYLSLAFFQGFQAFFLPILNEFRWSRTFVAGALSLRQVESGLLAPVVGFLVDRWGPREVIFGGVLLTGAGMIALGLMNSAWTFYLAFGIASIGASGASHGISWPVAVANWFRRLRGRALGATFLGPALSGPFVVLVVLLEEAVGWRAALISLGTGLWLVGIPLSLLARSRPEPYGYLPDGAAPGEPPHGLSPLEEATLTARQGEEPAGGLSAAQAIRTPAFWMLSLIFGVHGLGVNGVMAHQLPLLQGVGFSAREGALILGLIFFLSGIGRLGVGTLMDYVDRRLVLAAVLSLQAVSYLFLALLSTAWWRVAVFTLSFGAAFGSTIPARPILIRDLFGHRAFGAISGLSQGIAIVPGLFGPILMGAAFDLGGAYTPAIIVFGVLTFAVFPFALLLRVPAQGATAV